MKLILNEVYFWCIWISYEIVSVFFNGWGGGMMGWCVSMSIFLLHQKSSWVYIRKINSYSTAIEQKLILWRFWHILILCFHWNYLLSHLCFGGPSMRSQRCLHHTPPSDKTALWWQIQASDCANFNGVEDIWCLMFYLDSICFWLSSW